MLVSSASLPPLGMASRALSARLRIGGGELVRIDQCGPGVLGQQRRDLDVLAERRMQQLGGLQHQRIDVDLERLQRLLAGKGQQMLGQIGAAFGGFVDQPGDGGELGLSATASSRMPMVPVMTVRMLLKSCATPPVSWPIASIFCTCRNLGFRGLLFGQVAADEEMPPHRLRPGPGPVQRNGLAVLVDVAGLEIALLLPAPRRPHLVAGVFEIVGVDEFHRAVPDHLGRLVAEDGLDARADLDEIARGVGHQDEVVARFRRCAAVPRSPG